jgi:AbrB family looped-hinge helix DNA binding protein
MERLVVDTDGKIVIPPEVAHKRGLQPGDHLALLETEQGLLVCREGVAWLEKWWSSMTEAEKLEARQEADWYESLSDKERDAIWNAEDEKLAQWLDSDDDDDDEEGVPSDFTARQHPAG